MRNKVIVIGALHHNTLGVIRSLGQKGLCDWMHVILVCKGPNYIEHSRYIKKGHITRIESYSSVADTLYDMRPSGEEKKPVVICCCDTSISMVDADYERLSTYFLLPNAKQKQGEITRLLEKSIQVEIARKVGFNVPESFLYDKKKGMPIVWKSFPCIVKPLDILLGGKDDICVCGNEKELEYTLSNDEVPSVIIQSIIEKFIEFQIIGVSMGGV